MNEGTFDNLNVSEVILDNIEFIDKSYRISPDNQFIVNFHLKGDVRKEYEEYSERILSKNARSIPHLLKMTSAKPWHFTISAEQNEEPFKIHGIFYYGSRDFVHTPSSDRMPLVSDLDAQDSVGRRLQKWRESPSTSAILALVKVGNQPQWHELLSMFSSEGLSRGNISFRHQISLESTYMPILGCITTEGRIPVFNMRGAPFSMKSKIFSSPNCSADNHFMSVQATASVSDERKQLIEQHHGFDKPKRVFDDFTIDVKEEKPVDREVRKWLKQFHSSFHISTDSTEVQKPVLLLLNATRSSYTELLNVRLQTEDLVSKGSGVRMPLLADWILNAAHPRD